MTSTHDVLFTSGTIRNTPTLNTNYFRAQSAVTVLLPTVSVMKLTGILVGCAIVTCPELVGLKRLV